MKSFLFTLCLFLYIFPIFPLNNGYATYFDGLGHPYGGCGLPQEVLESQNFVALNVQNTPGDYTTYLPRPIKDPSKVGAFNNGYNCGRWVNVTIGEFCTGRNDGSPGSGFCSGGQWITDEYVGAQLPMLVTDSCQDGNEWCRDSFYHLDLHHSSLPSFIKNGREIGKGILDKWNNRKISWNFITAPNYVGDIKIGFIENSQPIYFIAIAVLHLPNGISGIERDMNGTWQKATMISDNGQAYQLPSGEAPYRIRLYDTEGKLLFGGRIYTFSFPASCGSRCSAPFTEVTYTISS
eukprot:TRINITY_DN5186_c0_g1_i1.p1 TRINITY_DN5186_c0_g1~~TRINITY_DN5186_c0_g1_i1.p1  ORF type:complete len:293 (-),score=32.91 TRINITY_DN5186_c0_g1_i1:53-931(-)